MFVFLAFFFKLSGVWWKFYNNVDIFTRELFFKINLNILKQLSNFLLPKFSLMLIPSYFFFLILGRLTFYNLKSVLSKLFSLYFSIFCLRYPTVLILSKSTGNTLFSPNTIHPSWLA